MFVKVIEGNGVTSPMVKDYTVPTETSMVNQAVKRVVVDTTVREVAVIGDIHGTTKFIDGYNHILKHNNHVEKIIVMGDHFDPYEDIPFDTMVERYEEFIDCMKHDDRIVSLLGNHDLSRYVIDGDQTSRTERFHVHINKLSELIESNLDESRLMFVWDNYLFSHAGVSENWVGSIAKQAGFDFEKLQKKGWTVGELSEIARYSPLDYSGWGNNSYQGPTWIRPVMLARNPFGDYNQVVGHTMVCIEENRDFIFGGFEFEPEKVGDFYKVKMSNDRDLWFTDNEGKPEYLIIPNKQ